MIAHLSEPTKRLADSAAWGLAGLATISFWQGFALAVTILAGLASLTLACIRIHDRLKFGHGKGYRE